MHSKQMKKQHSRLLPQVTVKQLHFQDDFMLPYIHPTVNDHHAKNIPRKPKGTIMIFFDGNPGFDIDFYENEPVSELRRRIGEATNVKMSNFNLISKNGTMKDNNTVKAYDIQPDSHIIVMERQAKKNKELETRKGWLECRKRRSLGNIQIDTTFLDRVKTNNNVKLQLKEKQKDLHLYKSVETFFDEIPEEFFD